jgi:hypothetical protein
LTNFQISGSLRHRQRDYPSTSLPQPFAQRNGNTGKIQQLASAPPILSCNQQHRQQEEELHQSEAEVQPLSGPNVEVIQIDDEEEMEQENAIMEVDGSADEQNEANENVGFFTVIFINFDHKIELGLACRIPQK